MAAKVEDQTNESEGSETDESAEDISDDTETESDEDILKTAHTRFQLAVEAETDMRMQELDDLRFCSGEQWDQQIRTAREMDRRPCLTINRLPQYVRQITNDQRQNRPSIAVNPVDSGADVDTAKILQGLIRHIEYNSNADVAYDTGFDRAVRSGRGYFRIITEYSDPMSFDQEIKIKRIRNAFSVFLDPTSTEPDASDANWGFVFSDMSQDDYGAQYPKSKLAGMEDWASLGNRSPGWSKQGTCRIAEYFYKTFEEADIVLIETVNGDTRAIEKSKITGALPDGFKIVSERKTILPRIKWLKINAVEILERTDWPGQWIPIIPILGEEQDIDGKRTLEGIVRQAKDSQRMHNYWASAETETIALAPRTPFIVAEGQLENQETQWRDANVKNFAFLQYKPISVAGVPVPPPIRNVYEPAIQAITQARMQSAEDMKATIGMYDTTVGMRSNETSGVAIQRRNLQSQTNNFHFIDNLTRALRHAGNIIIDLIPKIYDTARTVRILADDGTVDMVKINQMFKHNGKDKNYRFDLGRYDVTVSTGPSYATKRQEAVASILDFVRAYPPAAQIIGDLLAKNMDWPGAQEIAERLKKTLPPGIADDKGQPQIPPQAQAQLQQQGQMIQHLTQNLQVATEEIKMKKYELESRERIEMAKIKAQIEMKLADINQADSMHLMDHDVAQLERRLEVLKINQEIGNDNAAGANGAGGNQQPTGGQPPGQPTGETP